MKVYDKNIIKWVCVVSRYIIVCAIILLCFNCQRGRSAHKKELTKKVNKVFNTFLIKDRYIGVEKLLLEVDNFEGKFETCTAAKVAYLRAIKAYYLNLIKESYKFSEKTLALGKECNNDTLIGVSNHLLGITYGNNNYNPNYSLAFDYYKKALTLLEKFDDKVYVIDLYHNLCRNGIFNKDWERAQKYGLKGIQCLKETKEKQGRLKYLYIYLARSQINLGLEDSIAFGNIEKAKEIIGNNPNLKALRNINLAYMDYYTNKKNFKKAKKYATKADSLMSVLMIYERSKMYKMTNGVLELQKELEEEKLQYLSSYKKIAIIITIISIILMFLSFKFFKLFKKHKNSEGKIRFLLKENEKSLLSKLFVISTKNDLLKNMHKKVERWLNNNDDIKHSDILSLSRDLSTQIGDEEIWGEFKIHFEKTKPNFFERLKEINEDLTQKDLRQCSYIAANLNSKEVSRLTGIGVRSVETSRYRIKKKLNLDKESSLSDFLMSI